MAEQAQEMVVDATPEKKAFLAKRSTHEDRIKKDEEELKELLKEQTGDTEKEEGAFFGILFLFLENAYGDHHNVF